MMLHYAMKNEDERTKKYIINSDVSSYKVLDEDIQVSIPFTSGAT